MCHWQRKQNEFNSYIRFIRGGKSDYWTLTKSAIASKIYSSFEKGVITEIKGTICGGERTAAEGKWAQGGGIELPCVFKLYGDKSNKLIVKNKLR